MNPKSIREILVLHHSHTDIGFTHPPVMAWELHRRIIDEAIELCERTADRPERSRVRWTCETTAPLIYWLERASSSRIDRLRRLVRAGLVGAGAMYLNQTPLANIETLIRGLEPIAGLRKDLALPLTVAINNDINGLPWPVADLLLDQGVNLLLMGINVHFGAFPLQRPRGFQWTTPRGRALKAFNAEHYQSLDREARLGENSLEAMEKGLRAYLSRLQKGGYPYDFAYLSMTNPAFPDNNPPNPRSADLVAKWNEQGREPGIRFVLPEELAARLRAQPDETFSTHAGDWTDYWSFGAGSAAVETKVARHARRRLSEAETFRALASAEPKAPPSTWSDAWRDVLHYEEHTWCSSAALRTTPPEPVNETWYEKAIAAYRASSLAGLLFRDTLEAWAGNSADGSPARGVVAYNPTPCEKTGWVRVPASLPEGKWEPFSSQILQLEAQRAFNLPPDSGTPNSFSEPVPNILVGPIKLPAYGFRHLSLGELAPARTAPGLRRGKGFVESPFYRLEFDPKTGRVLRLLDKSLKRDLVDRRSPWGFFDYARETVSPKAKLENSPEQGREAFFETDWPRMHLGQSCWKPDWPARRQPSGRLLELRTELSAQGACLILRREAPGVEDLVQKISLDALRPNVVCEASFNKKDVRSAEGIYFTFPLALSNWEAHFDTAGIPVSFEHEQLPGSCRDWLSIDSWVSLHDAQASITLACPDTPLVQVGAFRFARCTQETDKASPPLLLAWPMNNYWNTNFRASQPGYAKFRYVLASSASYDPVESARLGLEAQAELEMHPVQRWSGSRKGALVRLSNPDLLLLGAASRGREVVLRLLNVLPRPSRTDLRIPGRAILSARTTNAGGETLDTLSCQGGALRLAAPPRSLSLVALTLDENGSDSVT